MRKAILWIVGAVTTAVIGLIVTGWWEDTFGPAPLAEQRTMLRTELSQGDNEVMSFEEVRLREDTPAFVIAVGGAKERYYAERSDVVYIYDFVDGSLERRSTFHAS